MLERDSQTIVLSRQSILLVTAVSVGLLTLCYVLGVQVGKQSAALRQTSSRGSGEDLQELPESIQDQLKDLEAGELVKTEKVPVKTEEPKPAPAAAPEPSKPAAPAATPEKPQTAKPAAPKTEEPSADESRWTLQLVSTTDPKEAERIVGKAKAAGFPTTTVKDKNLYKVRLAKPGTRPEIDSVEGKLKARGFKTYPIKVS